ncbi:hypothetical protein LTR09_002822 [Extremus antarcticus]|uniref:Uncharacterized protein n=1 Tax=Extremus antarcticus TaxID=702011 RepID=A0AAJ0LV43_9PEZI|nr:hypothetical protein LTR09_002822 [Extremus antarcticus]
MLTVLLGAIRGATEVLDKLPVHLETSLRCFPNYVVYSDYGENFHGQLIVNALEFVSQRIQEEHQDFELYRRLKQDGRSALSDGAFQGANSAVDGQGMTTGNAQNPGWKLDKWKFLPMVNRTLYDFPDMKWYIFSEADAYVVWSTMLQLLATLDSRQLVYQGQFMSAGADNFVYGGAGIIVSQAALQAVVAYYSSHKKELEDFTDHHWAGDAVLGKAFKEAGVLLTDIWPIMQGDYPGWLTYLPGGTLTDGIARAWCKPVANFHHVTPDAVRALWHTEQEWLERRTDGREVTTNAVA